MPSYKIEEGHRLYGAGDPAKIYEAGDTVTFTAEEAEPLLARGVLVRPDRREAPVKPTTPATPAKGKANAWSDDEGDEDEGEKA